MFVLLKLQCPKQMVTKVRWFYIYLSRNICLASQVLVTQPTLCLESIHCVIMFGINSLCHSPPHTIRPGQPHTHHSDVIMSAMASQITSLTIVYSTVYSGADQRKHQSSASLAFVRGIHRWPVNSQHKGPVTGKMPPFDDVVMPSYDNLYLG